MKTLIALALFVTFSASAVDPAAVGSLVDSATGVAVDHATPAEADAPDAGQVAGAVGERAVDGAVGAYDATQQALGNIATAHGPTPEPGSRADIANGLSTILSNAVVGLGMATDDLVDTTRTVVEEAQGQQAPDAADVPAGQAGGDALCSDIGSAPAGDVEAALAVMTRADDGTHYGAARWQTAAVGVSVSGTDVDEAALASVDEVLAWISDTTGVQFTRGAGGEIALDLSAGNRPRVVAEVRGERYVSAQVTVDPTHPHTCRWLYEELGQAAGAFGDHGPAGSLFSVDQTALAPSAFDTWVLGALYRAEGLDDASLRAQLQATS